jgi:hypothetical protein
MMCAVIYAPPSTQGYLKRARPPGQEQEGSPGIQNSRDSNVSIRAAGCREAMATVSTTAGFSGFCVRRRRPWPAGCLGQFLATWYG